MNNIYLIRHGQTEWNREDLFRGTSDIGLNDFGRRQAAGVGTYLQGLKLHQPRFITSPLSRAVETGQIAAAQLKVDHLECDNAFNDLDFGLWQGRPREEVAKAYPELYRRWAEEPEKAEFPEGETLRTLADRAEPALYRLAAASEDRDLVIVTHRVVSKVLLCLIMGAGLAAFWKIKQDTACINILEYKRSSFIINTVNETCHLQGLGPG